jgi:hypothetical protein
MSLRRNDGGHQDPALARGMEVRHRQDWAAPGPARAAARCREASVTWRRTRRPRHVPLLQGSIPHSQPRRHEGAGRLLEQVQRPGQRGRRSCHGHSSRNTALSALACCAHENGDKTNERERTAGPRAKISGEIGRRGFAQETIRRRRHLRVVRALRKQMLLSTILAEPWEGADHQRVRMSNNMILSRKWETCTM